MFLKNQQVTGEIKTEIKKILETNDNENTIQSLWDAAKAVLRELYSNTILPQETRKISNRLTLHLKQLEKQERNPPKISRRKEIIKI